MTSLALGDRVEYIGPNWPERKGWKGTLAVVNHFHDKDVPDSGWVKFDLKSEEVLCYLSSLRKIDA